MERFLPPAEYHARRLKYAPLEKAAGLALQGCGIDDARLAFISDTGNVIYRADTPQEAYSVRVYRQRLHSEAEIYGELSWLLDLRRRSEVSVPLPQRAATGQYVQEVGAGPEGAEGEVYQVVVFHWLPGRVVGEHLDTKIAWRMGQAMADLHAHAMDFHLPQGYYRPDSDWPGMGRLRAELPAEMAARIEGMLDEDELALCDEAAARCAAAIQAVDTRRDFGLIHSDLLPKNCLYDRGRLGVIDFEDCQFAPFTCDLAITLSSFDKYPEQEALEKAFLRGYAERRAIPFYYAGEVEAFVVERKLRLIRWAATWPDVDHFSFGRQMVQSSLERCRKYVGKS